VNRKEFVKEACGLGISGCAMSLVVASVLLAASTDNFYLRQKPPGDKPEVFAPQVISLDTRLETYPAFSPDLKTLFFSVVNAEWSEGRLLQTRLEAGAWTTPAAPAFSDGRSINWESSFAPDGKRMFFASNRPPSAGMDIWMVERASDTSWSAPVRLPEPVNSAADDGTPCVTRNGTLYFKSLRTAGTAGSWLYRAVPKDGAYTQVENLGRIIPTASGETEPFVSPDENYLIFTSQTRAGGRGGWDLWLTFQQKGGAWTEPVTLGPDINTSNDEYGPRVTPDGKYLFFTRETRGKAMDIYWASTAVIGRLRAERGL
jgi:Tol biopolymer transport system component